MMRLIDVDELKKRATKVMLRDAPECGEFDAVSVDDIDCIPTIDPETLRPTAHWVRVRDEIGADHVRWYCSKCHTPFDIFDNTPVEEEMYYCSFCGARMEDVPKPPEVVYEEK